MVAPPYLYDAVKTDRNAPYREFDPHAISRASFQAKPRMKKPEGPLVSFNQHPDSYLILPMERTNAKSMDPSVKKWIKWMRIIQLVLRCLEILGAVGILVMMILISGVSTATGWIMRITAGVAILHTVYGVYHLGRKPSGRTPASSASYMLFASFFDVSVVPFYAFSALAAKTSSAGWKTLLSNQDLTTVFTSVVFYATTIAGGLHLVSLVVSLYLAVTFRKITKLPPDMNPLEDNLTSRHKRSKSSISTAATAVSEKRLSTPLESKRSSGAPYEDLGRPPTIPFFHTRTQSTDSFSTYKSTPPPSRDARSDLPSRQYQVLPNPTSARSSIIGTDLKRSSQYTPSSPPKRGSYTEVSMSDAASHRSSRFVENTKPTDPWYVSDSLGKSRGRSSSPRKTPGPAQARYEPLHQRHDSSDDISTLSHPNPLDSNPSTPPAAPRHGHRYNTSCESPLSEISNLNNRYSGDIADQSGVVRELTPAPLRDFKAKGYGELKPGTPPIMIGGKNNRQASGIDFGVIQQAGYRREVSGKIAEEGRSERGFARFRKISGLNAVGL
ncbi:uncharacterized protein PAC_12131 [Phialocephala subalpina]|uniref:Uncharacterized protein n=1 Tax=Phialocephala subalpina TaxID=576137 RepID=A0A1L7XB28_9HELO|nr:uncharacterized protein PAC_12131 [Phialocephala subalpina]